MDLLADVERSFLEASTGDLVERTVQVTQVVLEAAGLTQPASTNSFWLAVRVAPRPCGIGSSRCWVARPASTSTRQGAVALGAALLGHSLVQRERGKRGLSLSEVLATPIGVAVKGGGMRRVLERNTRLPAEKILTIRSRRTYPSQWPCSRAAPLAPRTTST